MIITLNWTDEITYRLEGEVVKSWGYKTVYTGYFVETAPAGLTPGVPYYVKTINIPQDNADLHLPQNREFYDLVDFKGVHIRKILARNPNAEACATELRKTGSCKQRSMCISVEPAYGSTKSLFHHCQSKSVAQRLDIALQYALGCQELTRECNKLGPYRIRAIRDGKADNGVMEQLENGIRILLIDFASILLDKTAPAAPPAPDMMILPDTHSSVMSPVNTVPESNPDSSFVVSGKTDVYALGMLLASLFIHRDGEYQAPSTVWAHVYGWKSSESFNLDKLWTGFENCARKYEPTSTWRQTWIEADLETKGCKMEWERLADEKVLTAIRKLFFHSTRINPKDRINLATFINTIQQIIQMENNSPAKIPVSVYLFDQQEFGRYRSDYQRVSGHVMEREKQFRGSSAQALCLAFRNMLPTDKNPGDAVTVLSNAPVDRMANLLESCPERNGTGSSPLVHAVMRSAVELIHLLNQPGSRYAFTGHIHLFAPSIPALGTMVSFRPADGPAMGLNDLTDYLQKAFPDAVLRISAYTAVPPDPFSEDHPWYNHIPLGTSVSQTPPSNHTEPQGHSDFYDGPNDYFIELDNGMVGYVGMK